MREGRASKSDESITHNRSAISISLNLLWCPFVPGRLGFALTFSASGVLLHVSLERFRSLLKKQSRLRRHAIATALLVYVDFHPTPNLSIPPDKYTHRSSRST
jgi:predicted membrane metal-binding protein